MILITTITTHTVVLQKHCFKNNCSIKLSTLKGNLNYSLMNNLTVFIFQAPWFSSTVKKVKYLKISYWLSCLKAPLLLFWDTSSLSIKTWYSFFGRFCNENVSYLHEVNNALIQIWPNTNDFIIHTLQLANKSKLKYIFFHEAYPVFQTFVKRK